MTDRPAVVGSIWDNDLVCPDDAVTTCTLCGFIGHPTKWPAAGLCPACGALDLDGDVNRWRLLAWQEKIRKRRAAGGDQGQRPTVPGGDHRVPGE